MAGLANIRISLMHDVVLLAMVAGVRTLLLRVRIERVLTCPASGNMALMRMKVDSFSMVNGARSQSLLSDVDPVASYLEALSPGSRRTLRQSLAVMAKMMSGGGGGRSTCIRLERGGSGSCRAIA